MLGKASDATKDWKHVATADVQAPSNSGDNCNDTFHGVKNTAEAVARDVLALGEDLVTDTKHKADTLLHRRSSFDESVHFVKDATGALVQNMEDLGENFVSDSKQIEDLLLQHQLSFAAIDIGDNETSLLERISRALLSSVMIYAVADVRMLIRENRDEIKGNQVLVNATMDLPITNTSLMKVVQCNIQLMEKKLKKCNFDMYISAIKRYGDESVKQAALELDPENKPKKRPSIYPRLQSRNDVELHVFDDINSTKELVYGIVVER